MDEHEAADFIQTVPLLRERALEPDICIDFLPDPVGGYLREVEGALGGDEGMAPPDRVQPTLVPSLVDRRPLFGSRFAG